MPEYIYSPDKNTPIDEDLIGGKAMNLARLSKAGFNVPPWFVVTTHGFVRTINFYSSGENISDCCEVIERADLPPGVDLELVRSIEYGGLSDKLLAVRSSATGEDTAGQSFAGQLDSILFVRPENLNAAIKKVWASAFSDRLTAYLQENSIDRQTLRVAVIVQEMVNADLSGVAFGLDPVSGNRDSIVISAVYGLGEGLVSGHLDADTFRVTGQKLQKEIARKTQAVRFDSQSGTGTKLEPVCEDQIEIPALNDSQITLIAETVKKINRFYNTPQDVEWAITGDELYILQSRPVTALDKIPDRTAFKTIWDNSNIIESYPGVTTPLTFSFISIVYTEVYKQFCRIMGVEESLIETNDHIFSMIGLIKGRVYYNLLNWYNLLALLPGYSINASFMEQMMGVKEKLDLPLTIVQSQKNKYIRVLNLIFMLISNLLTLPAEIKKFYALLESVLKPFESIDLDTEKPERLMRYYFCIENSLIRKWHAPLVNDFFAMIFYGVLKKLISKWQIDSHDTLQNDLMIGQGDIISTQPVKNIRAIANKICQNDTLKELFLNAEAKEILDALPQYPEVDLLFRIHLKQFADRCVNELKLETITHRHRPELLIDIIKSYVRMGIIDPDEARKRELTLKENAEHRVKAALKGNPLKQVFFNLILKQARARVKDRENLRYERTRVFAQIREVFLAIGRRFYAEGILDNSRDIFYLSKVEIFGYIKGTAVSANLKEIVAIRKAEFSRYEQEKLPPRFETYGPVYHANQYQQLRQVIDEGETLTGTGCSPGVVRGRVRVVYDPQTLDELEGCILVAERTDPGWVPLFPLAKALLVERGSLLSHSAIVAREMGIPVIVGITNLLERLKNNDLVEMDGSTGLIKIIHDGEG